MSKANKVLILIKLGDLISLYKAALCYAESTLVFPLVYNYFKLYRRFTRRNLILKQVQGNKLYLNTQDRGISVELFVKKSHESISTEILKNILTETDHVLDIGANIGYYALLEAKLAKKGVVYAIEPDPLNFSILVKNIQINNLSNIKTFNMAISNKNDLIKFYIYPKRNICSIFDYGTSIQQILVESSTVDDFIKNVKSDKIDFIRMDVEGAEYEVLEGAQKTLERKNLTLFIEFHPDLLKKRGISVHAILKNLDEIGFYPVFIVFKNIGKVLNNISLRELLKNPLTSSFSFHAFLKK